MAQARALAEFLRVQVTLAGCCRALEPLIELARAGDSEAEREARLAVEWMLKDRK